ncbi:MAG: AraC family transcriptional regulator [Gammaproteobacteria bacterium]|nr:MAG: AraC family transcriptional regulator [Gammaproteobacteria bacterium]
MVRAAVLECPQLKPPLPLQLRESTLGGWGLAVADTLDRLGVNGRRLLEDAGASPDLWGDPDYRVPVAVMQRAWPAAVAATGDDAFGIHVAEQLQVHHFQSLGLALVSSDSIADMLSRLSRYRQAINALGDGEIRVSPVTITLEFRIPAGEVAPTALDAFIGFTVKLCRLLAGETFHPLEVALQRPCPKSQAVFGNWFACPIRYGASNNRLVLDRRAVERRRPGANPALIATLEQQVCDYLARFRASSLAERIAYVFANRLEDALPDEARVAHILGMSRRSLQAHLQQEGLAFRALRQTYQAQEARRLLAAGVPVTTVAYSLGFSDSSNFARAFRRWQGCSPSRYRSFSDGMDPAFAKSRSRSRS